MEDKGIKLSNQWTKPKVDKLELFKGIFNIIKNISTSDYKSIPADAVDTISAIKLEDSPGKIGWKLISRSLVNALLNLIVENNIDFKKEYIVVDDLDKDLNKVLEEEKSFIGVDFFKHPDKIIFIDKAKVVISEFLKLFAFNDNEINNLLNRLKSYFVFSLVEEWRKNYKYYGKLNEALVTPFDDASKKENEWNLYRKFLNKQIDAPVFSETFSLRQIYIPLRAYYKKKEETAEGASFKTSLEKKFKMVVADLETALLDWIENGDKNDGLRVIRGGPGYGKSSFLKMFATKLTEKGKRVIFVPLHRFEIKEDLIEAIKSFLRYDGFLTFDCFEEDNIILLFDGLDELSMQGALLADIANQFIREVERKISNFNSLKNKLKVIISGRDVIVQQNEQELRKDGQIFSVLPYSLTKEERKEYSDINYLLEQDQRMLWWKQYGNLTGKSYGGIPTDLQGKDLEEVTSQPLLNYLVAISYERGKIDFKANPNLNEIYNDLLEAVYSRNYAEGEVHQTVKKFKIADFVRMLEEIATAAWHGNGRTTTVAEIEQHFDTGGLKKLLDDFVKNAEKGTISLLAAFYFRQAGQDLSGAQTFEFTHKSFGEYLTAKRIINKVYQINKNINKNEENFDEGWTVKIALSEWLKLFGPKAIDEDLIKFIFNEVKLKFDKEPDVILQCQQSIIKLINKMLVDGMPLEELAPRPSYLKEYELAVNAEKALLIILSSISTYSTVVSNIKWPSSTAFGEWIGNLLGQRSGPFAFILNFLNHLNLVRTVLDIRDFYKANFSYSILDECDMHFAVLGISNSSYASLKRTTLTFASLQGINFQNAQLEEIRLNGSNMQDARLRKANLKGANLERANLTEADLTEANLEGANLQGANLSGAKLERTNFKRANLKGVRLAKTSLANADLNGAILDKKLIYKPVR